MPDINFVIQAKKDLEAQGQKWETACDAFKITNLAASRAGWKLQEKLSGDRCLDRKVDAIITDGHVFDVLINAGPPSNANIPAMQDLGPVGSLVPKDPFPVDQPGPDPIPPTGDLEVRVSALEVVVSQQSTAILELNRRVTTLEGLAGSIGSLQFDLEGVRLKLVPVSGA